MNHRPRWSSSIALAAIVGCAAITAPSALAASPHGVRVGSAPVVPRNFHVGNALPSTKLLNLTIALQPQDPAALQSFATAVADPSSPLFRQYLTVPEFAQRFGATTTQVQAVQSALRAQGLDVGTPAANNLTLPVTGTAGQVEKAFSTSLAQVTTTSGRSAYANEEAPAVPSTVASYVQGVIGLDSLALDQPQQVKSLAKPSSAAQSTAARSQVVTGGPQPCGEATAALNGINFTVDGLASAYQFSPLYLAGDLGAGQTVAVFEQQPYQPSDIATFQACFGTSASVTNVDVDGGPGPYTPGTSDDGEAALDIEVVLGMAPRANVLVYEGPGAANSPVDIISAIVTQNRARVISSSWGECEALTGGAVMGAENTLLQEAAAQGQTFVVSSGDSGSEQCSQVDPNNTSLSVLNPASQPFATGIGGTTMNPAGPPPSEYVWNEGPKAQGGGGSGGGVSAQWPMPAYQSTAPTTLGVINSGSSAAPCGSTSFCREVPDVAADADAQTGYVVYVNGGGQNGGWVTIGGTSAAAPLWAALFAVANSSPTCRGVPIGFANPSLYAIAGSSYLSNFHDVTGAYPGQGFVPNNDTLGVNNGAFPVGPNYDMTTGLGTPIAQTLAASLCSAAAPVYSVGVGNPGAQGTIVGHPVALQIAGSDSGAAPLSYSAAGLPAGLAINPATGVISGTPTTIGATTVTVAAGDRFTNAGSTAFTWSVVAPPVVIGKPKAAKATLSGFAKRKPKVAFTISAGAHAPLLSSFAITLPKGVAFSKSAKNLSKGIAIKGPGSKKLKYKLKLKKGVLTISLTKRASQARFTIAKPAIGVTSSLAKSIKRHKTKKLAIVVKATDVKRHTTKITFKPKVS